MNPLAWVGTTPAGWNYCFAQTASLDAAFSLTADNPAGKIAGYAGIYTTTGPSKGLDGSFPYLGRYFFSPNPTFIGDTPGPKIYSDGGTSVYYIRATTYYMCEPVDTVTGEPTGGWVPLAKLTWTYYVYAKWMAGRATPRIINSTATVSGNCWSETQTYPTYYFQAATTFPQWSAVLSKEMVNHFTGIVIGQ